MVKKTILILYTIIWPVGLVLAQDSIPQESENYFVAVPILFYGEETSWGMGATAGYYFTREGLNKASNIQGSLIYTLKNQISFSVFPKIYTTNKDFFYSGFLKANHYPDKFFEIGRNTPDSLEEKFTSKDISLQIQRQRVMFDVLMAGLQAQFGYYQIVDIDTSGNLYKKSITGVNSHFTSGLGLLMTWDNRNNFFYPTEGEFYKVTLLVNSKIFGSRIDYSRITVDLRNYYPIILKHIFALQVFADITWGNTPFQQMPALGGSDILRGFYKGRYRDKMMVSAQAEYRFPVYRWLKGSAFISTGDVAGGIDNFRIKEFRYSYGFGLRARVNPANVHLRFDVGFSQDRKPAFYLTTSEAF